MSHTIQTAGKASRPSPVTDSIRKKTYQRPLGRNHLCSHRTSEARKPNKNKNDRWSGVRSKPPLKSFHDSSTYPREQATDSDSHFQSPDSRKEPDSPSSKAASSDPHSHPADFQRSTDSSRNQPPMPGSRSHSTACSEDTRSPTTTGAESDPHSHSTDYSKYTTTPTASRLIRLKLPPNWLLSSPTDSNVEGSRVRSTLPTNSFQ